MGSTLKKTAIAALVATSGLCAGSAVSAQSAFDGFYFGGFIQNDFSTPAIDGAVGAWAGYNYDLRNGFVIGAEAEVQYDWVTTVVTPTGSAFTGMLNARAGYLASPDFMLFAKGGAGFMTSGVGFVYDYGAGAEFAISDRYLVRGEVVRVSGMGMNRSRTDIKLGLGYSF
ncbi:MAG: outer membrane beta-barrel protein [Pseudomonadota bacterium]|nr:outer membrane beta-barrel protein [Pseudomonadota bacterium]